jgi:hypothetical protein
LTYTENRSSPPIPCVCARKLKRPQLSTHLINLFSDGFWPGPIHTRFITEPNPAPPRWLQVSEPSPALSAHSPYGLPRSDLRTTAAAPVRSLPPASMPSPCNPRALPAPPPFAPFPLPRLAVQPARTAAAAPFRSLPLASAPFSCNPCRCSQLGQIQSSQVGGCRRRAIPWGSWRRCLRPRHLNIPR